MVPITFLETFFQKLRKNLNSFERGSRLPLWQYSCDRSSAHFQGFWDLEYIPFIAPPKLYPQPWKWKMTVFSSYYPHSKKREPQRIPQLNLAKKEPHFINKQIEAILAWKDVYMFWCPPIKAVWNTERAQQSSLFFISHNYLKALGHFILWYFLFLQTRFQPVLPTFAMSFPVLDTTKRLKISIFKHSKMIIGNFLNHQSW